MAHRAGILKKIKRAIRREDGTASIEFVILFPALMTLFLSSFEMSVLLLRSVMLDKSLDTTVRELRLGLIDTETQGSLKTRLCDRAPIIANCATNMLVELTPISTDTWAFPEGNAACTDKTAEIQPAVNVAFGIANDITSATRTRSQTNMRCMGAVKHTAHVSQRRCYLRALATVKGRQMHVRRSTHRVVYHAGLVLHWDFGN